MSTVVTVRKLEIGKGMPKICIPATDPDLEGIRQSVRQIQDAPHDLIEWRADFYKGLADPALRKDALQLLREALPESPILFTIRTSAEMGMLEIDTETYVALNLAVLESGLADLIDVELSRGEKAVRTLVEAARRAGVKVIISRHDFSRTPDRDVIVGNLCLMQEMGADIVKFAVMPHCERDVLRLLDATLVMKEHHPSTPVITMAMGSLGAVSRVAGETFGSAVTFGTAGKSSAPGQIPADRLALILKSLDRD